MAHRRRPRALCPGSAYYVARAAARPDDLGDRGRRPLPAAWRRGRGHPRRDRVSFDPGEEHWHGAAPTRFMVHVAIQQADDAGNFVKWGDAVTDEEYSAAPR